MNSTVAGPHYNSNSAALSNSPKSLPYIVINSSVWFTRVVSAVSSVCSMRSKYKSMIAKSCRGSTICGRRCWTRWATCRVRGCRCRWRRCSWPMRQDNSARWFGRRWSSSRTLPWQRRRGGASQSRPVSSKPSSQCRSSILANAWL